ncbi:flagellar hook-length control protein FliK [Vibrio sinaloensis DSM 21326]|uniref:Flagellar hook-length control protein FliK n=1 Tax=Vibrio sinaloensis DSM 21326 TaxID=945550 RepID=E8M3R2_PHOS4|nr:flagellar hook-length control protein FliK [Vibrio sinaloensis]EGA71351.1 flagellar hook-length control protein FliK [Vibrio sinaloensis DSM 21326]
MNINLSTVTDSPKATKVATDGSSEVSEEASSQGFFAKLSALIKGESSEGEKSVKAEQAEVTTSTESPESSEGDVEVKNTLGAENTSVDELLSEDGDVSADEADGAKKPTKADPQLANSTESEPDQNVPVRGDKEAIDQAATQSSKEKTTSTQAEKIIADNEEVLKRLDQSNSALQNSSGKALPQESQAVVQVSDEAEQSNAQQSRQTINPQEKLAQESAVNPELVTEPRLNSSAKADLSVDQVQAVGDEEPLATIPASAKPFIESNKVVTSDEERIEAEIARTQTSSQDVAVDKFVTAGQAVQSEKGAVSDQIGDAKPVIVVDGEEIVIQGDERVENASELSELEALKAQTSAELKMVDGAPVQTRPTDLAEVESSESESDAQSIATSALVGGTASAKVAESKLQSTKGEPVMMARTATQGLEVSEAATSTADVATDMTLAASATTAAIPWASASEEVVIADDVVLQTQQHSKAQQAAVAQSVHQALTQQQATQMNATAQLNAATAPAINSEVTANQLQAMAHAAASAPVNVAANSAMSEQAMLKAAMGAKAVGTLANGKATQPDAGSAGESGFAQQLSQAAGVSQTANAQNLARAEQAAQQVPLQLNRDMAGEQVAERVQMMLSKNLKNIDIRLDPPELGRMQIRMNMNGDGATVHFTVANQQARDVLEQSMPRLREMLAQQGVQLGDTSVQQQASGQQQNRYAAGGQGQTGQGSSNQAQLGEENLEPDINLDLNVAAKRDGISYYA